ncbi:hypothetical protein CEXT_773201 [Caerostris extrusa]|uniref:Uncharacterized protein n=1 Tax=Caerostris extrusa TaxID=172846 RepID=A0AAV4PRW2_CAEEX|nr:hypothetical protein CEXT_773201 [Caerostris extrusa]
MGEGRISEEARNFWRRPTININRERSVTGEPDDKLFWRHRSSPDFRFLQKGVTNKEEEKKGEPPQQIFHKVSFYFGSGYFWEWNRIFRGFLFLLATGYMRPEFFSAEKVLK